DNCEDVFAQATQQRLTIECSSFFVFKNPSRRLVVPDERMSNDEHAALLTKRNKTIGSNKIVLAWLWMDQRPLQDVLRSDGVELRAHNLSFASVLFKELSPIKRNADHEVVFE